MAETVGQHQQTAFTVPINGTTGDAAQVLGNDNTIRGKHNDHDADPGVHIQSSTLASRPAAGVSGRKWYTTDEKKVYYDNGVTWDEIGYAASANANVFTTVQTITRTNGTDIALTTKRAADSGFRLNITADGELQWDDGTGGTELTLGRFGADRLTIGGGALTIGGTLTSPLGTSGANSGASVDIDISTGMCFTYTLNANTAFTFSNGTQFSEFYLVLIGDGTSRTPTFPANVRWAGAAAPAWTSTAGRIDVAKFMSILVPGPTQVFAAARIMTNCG